MALQEDWRWCRGCHGLFFSKLASSCAAGGMHVAEGGAYVAYHGVSGPNLQQGWRWCRKCQGLFAAGDRVQAGICPNGGPHDATGSGVYAALFDVQERPEYAGVYQHRWRWCSLCLGLFYGELGGGRCPGGGAHRDGSGRDYVVLVKPAGGSAAYERAADIGRATGEVVSPAPRFGGPALDRTLQDGWRWCRRCKGLFYGPQPSRCPAGGGHDATGSGAYFLYHDQRGTSLEQSWRWCHKCQGLFYSEGVAAGGACPVGGLHDSAGSGSYGVLGDVTEKPEYQPCFQHKWRRCGRCRGLFHGEGASACSAGGEHRAAGSTDYSLLVKPLAVAPATFERAAEIEKNYAAVVNDTVHVQGGWRWCRNCHAVFHGANPSRCPGGGGHVAEGSAYFQYVDMKEGQQLQGAWRWCRNCQGMFYSDGQARAGVCAAGGTHDSAGSGAYTVFHGVQERAAFSAVYQHEWRWCSRCQSLFYGPGGGGQCPAGGQHVVGQTDYVLLNRPDDSVAEKFAVAAAIHLTHAQVGFPRPELVAAGAAPATARVDASCKLIVEYGAQQERLRRFQVVLVPRRADGTVMEGAAIRVHATSRLVIEREVSGAITQHVVDPSTPLVLTASATGRCRFTLAPLPERLTVPLLLAQVDGMEPGQWSVFSPDSDLHRQLAGLTADAMFATPKGKSGPLLNQDGVAAAPGERPTVTRADAEALAGAVSTLMRACVDCDVGTHAGEVSFSADEPPPRAEPLAPVFAGEADAPPVFEVDPGASFQRVLARRPTPAPAPARGPAPAGEEDGAAASFGLFSFIEDAVDTVVRVSEDVGGGIVGAGEAVGSGVVQAGGAVVSTAEQVGRATADVGRLIGEQARGPIGSVAQVLDTAGAAAQRMIESAALAVAQPVAQFTAETIASAKQLAIDVGDGIVILALTVVNGVDTLVKTVIHEVEALAQVVAAFFKRVGLIIEMVIEFLCALFDWDDILRAQEHIERHLDDYVRSLDEVLAEQRSLLPGRIADLRARLAGVQPKPPVRLPPVVSALGDIASFGGPLGYLLDKVESYLPSLGDVGLGDLSSWIPTFPTEVNAELAAFGQQLAASQLPAALKDPRAFVELGTDALLSLVLPVADAALAIVGKVADALLVSAGAIVKAVDAVLKFHLDIPILTRLIELIVFHDRQRLSIRTLLTLLAAALVTVIHKLHHGTSSGPFDAAEGEVSFGPVVAAPRVADLALTSVAIVSTFVQLVLTGVAVWKPALSKPLGFKASLLGVFGNLPTIPLGVSSDSRLFGEQWFNWVANLGAGGLQCVDAYSKLTGTPLLFPAGTLAAGCAPIMVVATALGHAGREGHGDTTRANLDIAAQAAASFNNLTSLITDDQKQMSASCVGLLTSLVVGCTTLGEMIRNPEAQLG